MRWNLGWNMGGTSYNSTHIPLHVLFAYITGNQYVANVKWHYFGIKTYAKPYILESS